MKEITKTTMVWMIKSTTYEKHTETMLKMQAYALTILLVSKV